MVWLVRLKCDLETIVDGCPVKIPIDATTIVEIAATATPQQKYKFLSAHPEAMAIYDWRKDSTPIRVSEGV